MLQNGLGSLKRKRSREAASAGASMRGGRRSSADIHVPEVVIDDVDEANEQTPLLDRRDSHKPTIPETPDEPGDVEGQIHRPRHQNKLVQSLETARRRTRRACLVLFTPKSWDRKVIWQKGVKEPVGLLPCVFLGVLLNVLDALSYGRFVLLCENLQAHPT